MYKFKKVKYVKTGSRTARRCDMYPLLRAEKINMHFLMLYLGQQLK